MKSLITILLLYASPAFSQHIQWQLLDESHTMNYEVQYSADSVLWAPIAEVAKGNPPYDFAIPVANWKTGWYKVVSIGDSTIAVTSKIIVSTNSVTITSATFKATSLTWKTTGEVNVDSYLIQKTRNGSTTKVTQPKAKGSGTYTYRMARTMYTYTYKITPIFKDKTPGPVTNFK